MAVKKVIAFADEFGNNSFDFSKEGVSTHFIVAHRSILHAIKSKNNAFYKDNVAVPYQNPTDKRIMGRIANGHTGRMPYSWFYYDLVKNVSKDKTFHSCQIPLPLRDLKAVQKIATAYSKLLFPHITKVEELDKKEFELYCLEPAIRRRGIIREQCHKIDEEFKEYMPDIRLK